MWAAAGRRGQHAAVQLVRAIQGKGVSVQQPARFMASGGGENRGPVYTSIVKAVTENLSPTEVELIDDSASHAGHAGMKGREAVESHFKLRVVSAQFEGMRLVQRHQLVYSLLTEQFKAGLHALNIDAKTPAEVAM